MNQTLDSILDKKSKIKVLRLFVSRTGGFMASGRETARLAGITAPSAHAALKELHDQGVMHRRVVGRDHIYQLNPQAPVVSGILAPMFARESALGESGGRPAGHVMKEALL